LQGTDIAGKWSKRAVILPAKTFCCEIKALQASFGFAGFCPFLRWQAYKYPQYSCGLPPETEQNPPKPRMEI
jgi:hypothetical protein